MMHRPVHFSLSPEIPSAVPEAPRRSSPVLLHVMTRGVKTLFQRLSLLPTCRSSSVRSLTNVTHLSSHCSHFSLAPVDDYMPKQEAPGVQRANLSEVDFPEPSDLYILLAQRQTLQSGLDCGESSGVKRKKKKIIKFCPSNNL